MTVLSVVMPARNAAATIADQLRALGQQTYRGPWELIVVDNGSTDGTREVVERVASGLPLRIISSSAPGTNRARNAGAQAATGEFLVFVDADDRVARGWLRAMADASRHADAVCGALEFTGSDRGRTDALRPWPGYLPFAPGANCGVRTSIFRELGGFDAGYSHGGDDVEFFWRLQLAHHEIVFVPDAVVHYRERAQLSEIARQFLHYGRQDPHLFRDFRRAGMPASGVISGLRAWGHLIVLAPWYWSDAARRRQWVRSASRRLGRIRGSVQWRTLYF
jgi:glycosyltransferase involved in cell wall biosynthesis